MWGRENDPTQKGMNFASVAATGAPTNGPQPLPNMQNYLESSPPQVRQILYFCTILLYKY